MSDDESSKSSSPESDSAADASYEKWKYAGWDWIPFRSSFFGLLLVGFGVKVAVSRTWETGYRWAGIALGLLFLGGLMSLFYDIPRRRLSTPSKFFLSMGLVAAVGLIVFAMAQRWRAS